MSELIQRPVAALLSVKALLSRLTDSSTPLLPFIPKPLKFLLLILLLSNSPSIPFSWHVRVWYWPLKAYYEVYRKGRTKYLDEFERNCHAKGGIELKSRLKRIAFFDDCDYNLHLSNSCYAKNVDAARMQWCIQALAPVYTPNCHMALGASHYVFIKEIPLGSEYVMESHMGGWGDKWLYLITEFIIYPKKSAKSKGKGKAKVEEKPHGSPIVPSIDMPASGTATPVPGQSTPTTSLDEIKRNNALRVRQPREDGGIVCALAVSEYCFKVGRVTIPPRVAFHFAMLSPDKAKRDHARDLIMTKKDHGYAWLKSGWKDEPNADEIGLDIGGEGWVRRGKEGMEKVTEGLGVF